VTQVDITPSVQIDQRISFTYTGRRLTLGMLSFDLEDLLDLLALGVLVDVRSESHNWFNTVRATSANRRELLQETEIHRISKQSPLELILGWTAVSAAGLSSARGVLHIWRIYEDARSRRARTEYEVAAYRVLRDLLPSVASTGQPEDESKLIDGALEKSIKSVGRALADLTAIEPIDN